MSLEIFNFKSIKIASQNENIIKISKERVKGMPESPCAPDMMCVQSAEHLAWNLPL